jgi:hypothetical protein
MKRNICLFFTLLINTNLEVECGRRSRTAWRRPKALLPEIFLGEEKCSSPQTCIDHSTALKNSKFKNAIGVINLLIKLTFILIFLKQHYSSCMKSKLAVEWVSMVLLIR